MKINTHILKPFFILLIVGLISGCASINLKNGREAYENYKYQDAIYFFEKSLKKKDNAPARRMLAESYLLTNNFTKAAEQYEQAANYTDNSDADRINYGKALMAVGKYDEAKGIFEGVASRDGSNMMVKELLLSCKKMNDLIADSLSYSVEPVSIPNAIGAYSPVMYKNGIIFSSPSGKGEKDPYTNNSFANLFYTTENSDGTWGVPVEIANVNGRYHDAVAAISPGGQTMIFTRSFQLNAGALSGNKGNVSNVQLYTSKMGADGNWEKPTLVPFSDPTSMYAHPAFSPDGATLYFASDMEGGRGGMDIWSAKLVDNNWSAPVNLGPEINSNGDDVFPTIKGADSLYFSSDGHKSIGGMDVNLSVKRGGKWSSPEHISYPINTAADDFGMIWNKAGNGGYLSSDRTGSDKIYKFKAENTNIPFEMMVTGKDSGLPLGGVKVTIKNLTDGTEKILFTDGNGMIKTELQAGKEYQLISELEGYFKNTDLVSTKGSQGGKALKKVVELPELYVTGKDDPKKDDTTSNSGDKGDKGDKGDNKGDKGDTKGDKGGNNKGDKGDKGGNGTGSNKKQGTYPVPNIYWDYNEWTIREDAIPYLDNLVKLFRDNEDLKFEIQSHCDCRGSDEYNEDLSSKRAKAVVDYLVKKGVPRSIMVSKGYGESKLLNNCTDGVLCSEDKHQENRRTEFIVTGKKKK